MGYDISTLPKYVEQRRELILRKAILEGDTIRRMRKQTGIKTSAALNYLNTTPVIQDGNACGFTPQGDAKFSQRQINTAIMKVNMEFCDRDLLDAWTQYQVTIAATENKMPFEEEIIRDILSKIAKVSDRQVWQGDTASSDANLAFYDGLLKLANTEDGVIKVPIAAGGTAWDAIAAVYMAMPEELLEQEDARIFVSPALYRQFIQEIVAKNYYHYSGPQDAAPKEFIFPGTNVSVASTPGLSGTQNIMAAAESNLFYGVDLENAREIVDAWYSKDADKFRLRILWNAGVQFAFPDEVVLGTIATPTAGGDTGTEANAPSNPASVSAEEGVAASDSSAEKSATSKTK